MYIEIFWGFDKNITFELCLLSYYETMKVIKEIWQKKRWFSKIYWDKNLREVFFICNQQLFGFYFSVDTFLFITGLVT